ncbi:MAG: hypothetical protein RDU25_00530 [Patescibacteria group bacterium]|nr:hypothetical protein [Patescibacteria group bacterium]
MQTEINSNQRIIVAEGTDSPPLDDLKKKVGELGAGWRIQNVTTTTETVAMRGFYQSRTYKRYTMTAVMEKAA